MKLSDIKRCFHEINEFQDINHLNGLAYTVLNSTSEYVNLDYFDEVYGEAIKAISKISLFNGVEFALVDTTINILNKLVVKYHEGSFTGLTPDQLKEAYVTEFIIALQQKILDALTAKTEMGVIDVTALKDMRWSQERFALIANQIKPNTKYILSPKVSAAIQCLDTTIKIDEPDRFTGIVASYMFRGATIYVDNFATSDYILRIPDKVLVNLEPTFEHGMQHREDCFDDVVIVATRGIDVYFQPMITLYKVVGFDKIL